VPGEEFTIGNNDGEDVGVTKTIRNFFSEESNSRCFVPSLPFVGVSEPFFGAMGRC
jgi:hypothetical protein